jgi:hypothetical protein
VEGRSQEGIAKNGKSNRPQHRRLVLFKQPNIIIMAKDNNVEKQLDVGVQDLLSEYLNVCNRAMEENKHKFFYQQAKKLNRMVWDEANFHTIIYDEDPENVIGEFTIHFNSSEGKLSVLPSGNYEVAFSWKMPLNYLLDVVENRPEWYIDNPVMLDWAWLTLRVSTGLKSLMKKPRLLSATVVGFGIGVTVGVLTAVLATCSKRFRMK